MEALGRVGHRYAGTEGERAMVHAVKSRLPRGVRARVEGFVAYTSPAFIIGLHALLLLMGGVLGFWHPFLATVICAVVTAHLVSEHSGGRSLIRRVMPKDPSYNLVATFGSDSPLGTVVVTAGLDQPRWRPNQPKWLKRPIRAVVVAAVAVTVILLGQSMAEPWGRPTQSTYVASLVVFALAIALGAVAHRRAGTREDASAPAALIELMRRFGASPALDLDVCFVFTGCSHAYQNGMHAFLATHKQLAQPVFVLALDRPGCPDVGAVTSEGSLLQRQHRPTGPAMIERLRWGGITIENVDRPYVTDARAALLWGYRALGLSGGDGPSDPETAATTVEIAESLVRLYGSDLSRVHDLAAPDQTDEVDLASIELEASA